MERVKGIEPSSKAWEAFVLPLNYTRATCGYPWERRKTRHCEPAKRVWQSSCNKVLHNLGCFCSARNDAFSEVSKRTRTCKSITIA
jgi:hypothetical protein